MDALNGTRVFIANYAGHDYTDLKRYCDQSLWVFVTRGFISYQGLDRVKFQVAQGILESRPDDWLALSGTNIINAIAAVLWFQKHGKVKILNYDKNSSRYRELILSSENNAQLFSVLAGET